MGTRPIRGNALFTRCNVPDPHAGEASISLNLASCPTRDPSDRRTPWAGTSRCAHQAKTFSDAGCNRRSPQGSPLSSHQCFFSFRNFLTHLVHDHHHLLICLPITLSLSVRSSPPNLSRLFPIFFVQPVLYPLVALLATNDTFSAECGVCAIKATFGCNTLFDDRLRDVETWRV